MGLIAKARGGDNIPPMDEGVYIGVCYGVVDLGTQYSEHFRKSARKVQILWEIPDERIDVERDGKTVNLPRGISKRYTLGLGKKANLRADLQAWRGKVFTDEELEGFDLDKILGRACQIQVTHSEPTKDGKIFANVGSIMALPKGMKAPDKTENPIINFVIEEGEVPVIPTSMPQWLGEIIMKSEEFTGQRHAGGGAGQERPLAGQGFVPPKFGDDEQPSRFSEDTDNLPF
jgi:hypothetical protein